MFSNSVSRIYASCNYYSNKPYIFTNSRYNNYNGKSSCTLKLGHLEVFLYRNEVWLEKSEEGLLKSKHVKPIYCCYDYYIYIQGVQKVLCT
jgi:hypothetical protein